MNYAEICRRIAPCGLDCGKCFSFPDSPIGRLARELDSELGGFGQKVAFFSAIDPVFADFPGFEQVLKRLGTPTCQGCRSGECLLGECGVKECVKQKGVDFCFQCPDFPCAAEGMPDAVKGRWLANNQRMKEDGVEAYFDWIKDKPRY